ncbi:MAG TPA: mechanosensitive ion channel family protein [Pseudomonadales bacterium]|nr:mechanosensitive ion channel family protein [Pseudomonadales bacterium]
METAPEVLVDAALPSILRAIVLLVLGLALARLSASAITRLLVAHPDRQMAMLARKSAFWGLSILTVVMVIQQLGFDLGVLLGAAGILTVAIGFASQTSASNLISGLFLLGERPFAVGDIITIGDATGEVLSIDALSVKLRTFDNIFVRIPNESIIKDRVRTLTRFPIRRIDIKLTVRFDEDLVALEDCLRAAVAATPLVLEEPRPLFIIRGWEEYGLGVQFSLWGVREQFLDTRNAAYVAIRDALQVAGVEIPYRHLTVSGAVFAGAAGDGPSDGPSPPP